MASSFEGKIKSIDLIEKALTAGANYYAQREYTKLKQATDEEINNALLQVDATGLRNLDQTYEQVTTAVKSNLFNKYGDLNDYKANEYVDRTVGDALTKTYNKIADNPKTQVQALFTQQNRGYFDDFVNGRIAFGDVVKNIASSVDNLSQFMKESEAFSYSQGQIYAITEAALRNQSADPVSQQAILNSAREYLDLKQLNKLTALVQKNSSRSVVSTRNIDAIRKDLVAGLPRTDRFQREIASVDVYTEMAKILDAVHDQTPAELDAEAANVDSAPVKQLLEERSAYITQQMSIDSANFMEQQGFVPSVNIVFDNSLSVSAGVEQAVNHFERSRSYGTPTTLFGQETLKELNKFLDANADRPGVQYQLIQDLSLIRYAPEAAVALSRQLNGNFKDFFALQQLLPNENLQEFYTQAARLDRNTLRDIRKGASRDVLALGPQIEAGFAYSDEQLGGNLGPSIQNALYKMDFVESNSSTILNKVKNLFDKKNLYYAPKVNLGNNRSVNLKNAINALEPQELSEIASSPAFLSNGTAITANILRNTVPVNAGANAWYLQYNGGSPVSETGLAPGEKAFLLDENGEKIMLTERDYAAIGLKTKRRFWIFGW